MSLLGFSLCTQDQVLPASLGLPVTGIDSQAIPALLRRRTSQATQLAFSAANRACEDAQRSPAELPAIFASVGGEIQVTDQLCIELGKPDGVISPTAFHNSVHNTAAGYWTIVHHCTQAVSALSAGQDTFAMALLEAWCQLACRGGELLLVCHDERWPEYLSPPLGAMPFAGALVLGAGWVPGGIAMIGRPRRTHAPLSVPEELRTLIESIPAAACIPLLIAATEASLGGEIPLSGNLGWCASLLIREY